MITNMSSLGNYFNAELGNKEFDRLSKFIMSEYGIKMPPEKKIMLQGRLQRRLKALNMNNFKDYVEYVFSATGQSEEVIHMMDVVSTNKTDFFREPKQFEFLFEKALPALNEYYGSGVKRNLKIWSAGCSSGEEPYTIAISIAEFNAQNPAYRSRRSHCGAGCNVLFVDQNTERRGSAPDFRSTG